jgi:hypothetical protein
MILVMAAFFMLAVSSLISTPCQAWQVLVDDDSYSTNKLREHWFRGPDSRWRPRWNGWTGYGSHGFYAARGNNRKHRPTAAGAR